MKYNELSFRNALNIVRQLFRKPAGEYFLCFLAGKGFDHTNMIASRDIIVKG